MWSTNRHPAHPGGEELEAFALGQAAAPEAAREHLEAGCPHCLARLRAGLLGDPTPLRRSVRRTILAGYGAPAPANGGPPEASFRDLGRRLAAVAMLVDYEERAGSALLHELLTRPAEERREVIRTERRFQALGLARYLAARSREEVFHDVQQAVELGALAREVADRLEEAGYLPGLARDAQALAWGALGNAYRVATDLFEAERALRTGLAYASDGSGHPMVEAEVLSLLGSLRVDQTRFEESVRVLERAQAIYHRHGATQAEAKVVVKLAKAAGEGGDPEAAVRLLERAEAVIDPHENVELLRLARHARSDWLAEAGRAGEARAVFEELKPDWLANETSLDRALRLDWLEAVIARAEGDLPHAEAKLREVQAAFGGQELFYDYALVSLDLAALLLEQDRMSEVREARRGHAASLRVPPDPPPRPGGTGPGGAGRGGRDGESRASSRGGPLPPPRPAQSPPALPAVRSLAAPTAALPPPGSSPCGAAPAETGPLPVLQGH